MILPLKSKSLKFGREAGPSHVDPIHWHQSLGYARQACARIFRDGGNPADALLAFGLEASADIDWGRAVERIAEQLTAGKMVRRAA